MRRQGTGAPFGLRFWIGVVCLMVAAACWGQASAGSVRRLVQHVEPVYPEIAERNKLEGAVVLRIVIEADGHVSDVRLASGNAVLVKAAMDAVKVWRYTAAAEASVGFVQINFGAGKAR